MDPNRLKAFVGGVSVVEETSFPSPSSGYRSVSVVEAATPMPNAEVILLSDPENLSTEAMVYRLSQPDVDYTQLSKPAQGFACGNCKFVLDGDGFCANARVMAYVSEESGCCNRFQAIDMQEELPSSEWAASECDTCRHDDEDEEDAGDDHDEGTDDDGDAEEGD